MSVTTQRPSRALLLAVIPVTTLACQPDPVATDLDSWYYGLSAVLVENTTLAHDIQEFAADISKARKDGKVSAKKTAKSIRKTIAPAARTVAEHAADVRPQTAEYQVMHDELATIWTERADTYDSILTAWDDGDGDGIQTGMDRVRDLRIAESFWFTRTNAVLEPKGYRFEEFPQTVPVPPTE